MKKKMEIKNEAFLESFNDYMIKSDELLQDIFSNRREISTLCFCSLIDKHFDGEVEIDFSDVDNYIWRLYMLKDDEGGKVIFTVEKSEIPDD
jgi:hypothetical protein